MQIDVVFGAEKKNTFAYFFSINDKKLYFSAIYELKKCMNDKEYDDFRNNHLKDLEPFDSFATLDEEENVHTEIHLYGEVEVEKFAEDLLVNIEEKFTKDDPLINQLRRLSKL